MITNRDFALATVWVANNFSTALPVMVTYKNRVQTGIIDLATPGELDDVRHGRINQAMIDKLCRLAKDEWATSADATALYCAAMAVATIVKEYGWGLHYLMGNGLWEMANRIQTA